MSAAFTEERLAEVETLRETYPDQRSALIPVLKMAQEDFGHLSAEVVDYVAGLLDVPAPVVAGVATFYHNLHTSERGRHVIGVCRTLSCQLGGAAEVSRRFCELLDIKPGGTSADGLITVTEVECLAACGTAPAVMVDDEYHESFAAADCERVVDALRAGKAPDGGSGIPGGPA
jgi:NADH-quinone oxidoreductase subunit E